MIKCFTLTGDQTRRALEAGGPLAEADPTRLKDLKIAAVEVDGLIVAYWVTFYGLHAEPLFVAEPFRKNPAVISGIVAQLQAILQASQEPAAFCVIEDQTAAVVSQYADRLGFHQAPAKLYYLVVEPAAQPVGG